MRGRLEILDRHGIRIDIIHQVIGGLDPLPGAVEFIAWARNHAQVIILSDTFVQFAQPLLVKMGWPTIFCHSLEIAADGRITGYSLRQPDQKRKAVATFRLLNFRTCAVGDSYNDTTMLGAADQGILFRPSANVVKEFPQYPVVTDHTALRARVEAFLSGA
jgi:phosphoserine/homoserine phosphotransferase